MIDYGTLLQILPVFMAALISPGPDFMIVSSMSLSRGRAEGIRTAAGIASVIAIYTFLCLVGLAALFARYYWLALLIKISGGLYLLCLGCLLWRSSLKSEPWGADEDIFPHAFGKRNAYLIGVTTCLTNPKAIAFFASIFSLALTKDTDLATDIAIGFAVPTMTFIWFACVALSLSRANIRQRYQKFRHVVDRIAGSALGFFGLKLILHP